MALVYADDLETVETAYQKLVMGQDFEAVPDFRMTDKSGDIKWISIRGTTIEWEGKPAGMSFTQDITRHKQAEEASRKSEERFRATFEQAAVDIAHVALDGTFLRLNQKFRDIVGYTQDEMVVRTFQDITHPDDLDADLEYMQQLSAGAIPWYTMEKRYYCKKGEIVWVSLTASMVRNDAGEPDYFVSVVEDVSERKQMEIKLRQHRDELEDRVANRTHELASFIDLSALFAEPGSLSELLEVALDRIIGLEKCQTVALHLTTDDHADLTLVAQRGLSPAQQQQLQQLPLEPPLSNWLAQRQKAVLALDPPTAARLSPQLGLALP